jgi:hypothetical protein
MIKIYENFLDKEELELYNNLIKLNLWQKTSKNDTWNERLKNLKIKENKNLIKKIKNKITSNQNCSGDIYLETLQLVSWKVGDEQDPHADSENADGSLHPYPWRNFSSIVYLNDSFLGGQTYFLNQNIYIQPKVGTLVCFPGTVEFLHGVEKILKGNRYTIILFWTYDKEHSQERW